MFWKGRLDHIHICAKASEDMRECAEVRLVAGRGIEGDRYFLGTGTYSDKPAADRQVTLIESETMEALARDHGMELTPVESRRNLTVTGVPLNHLVGRHFRVGETVLYGGRLNTPCKYFDDLLGKKLFKLLLNRSGLNCEIVEGGVIRPGDIIEPYSLPE